jgi:hypothetical protein
MDDHADATGDDRDHAEDEPGRTPDDAKEESLPPGAGIRGDEDEIPGNAGWGTPSEDAPGEGRLSPEGDNPPP